MQGLVRYIVENLFLVLTALMFLAMAVFAPRFRRLITGQKRAAAEERMRRCRHCGYVLENLDIPRCPECGRVDGFDCTFSDMGVSEEDVRRHIAEKRAIRQADDQRGGASK